MTVDPATAASAQHAGVIYYFCSTGDRDAFVHDPQRYVSHTAGANDTAGTGTETGEASPHGHH